jgi:hypothetical protein
VSKSKAIAAGAAAIWAVSSKTKLEITVINTDGKWDLSTIPEPFALNLTTEKPKPVYNKQTKQFDIPPKRQSIGLIKALTGIVMIVSTVFVVAGV